MAGGGGSVTYGGCGCDSGSVAVGIAIGIAIGITIGVAIHTAIGSTVGISIRAAITIGITIGMAIGVVGLTMVSHCGAVALRRNCCNSSNCNSIHDSVCNWSMS